MAGSSTRQGRTGRPPVTSRAEILAAARRLIERDGWERLTVRRLAAELGIGTTTLYHHVRDREDLLVQLINEHAGQAGAAELPSDPRERVVAAAVAIRDSLASWPWAAEILTADGFLGRLGQPALEMVEAVLEGAAAGGCTPEQSVDLFRSIWYCTVGDILVRVTAAPRGPAPRDAFLADPGSLDLDRIPRLAAIGDRWPDLAARDTFAETAGALADGWFARAAATQGDR